MHQFMARWVGLSLVFVAVVGCGGVDDEGEMSGDRMVGASNATSSNGTSSNETMSTSNGTMSTSNGTMSTSNGTTGDGGCRSDDACAEGMFCQEGVCLERVCEPGERRCVDEAVVEVCDVSGEGYTIEETCERGCAEGACFVGNLCPTSEASAVIVGEEETSSERLQAAPNATVLLNGALSTDPDGSVVAWEWAVVESPTTSSATLEVLGGGVAQFEFDAVGDYLFELNVLDNENARSCESARVHVTVVPTELIYIELTWFSDGPEVLYPPDLDLHIVKMGPGAWNSLPYDVHFANTSPYWSPETPVFLGDSDGYGPEVFLLDDPADCTWYAVGVHAWNLGTLGAGYPEIRVYVDGDLVGEFSNEMYNGGEFWDVGRLHWSSGEMLASDTPLAPLPRNEPPLIIPSMDASGLCGVDELRE